MRVAPLVFYAAVIFGTAAGHGAMTFLLVALAACGVSAFLEPHAARHAPLARLSASHAPVAEGDQSQLFVRKIAYDADETAVREAMEQFGPVARVHLPANDGPDEAAIHRSQVVNADAEGSQHRSDVLFDALHAADEVDGHPTEGVVTVVELPGSGGSSRGSCGRGCAGSCVEEVRQLLAEVQALVPVPEGRA